MLKRLRIKFVCINMAIVTVMLAAIFALILGFTKHSLETQSIRMMTELATNPVLVMEPDRVTDQVRLPYFYLQLSPQGELLASGGSYYDLSNRQFLRELLDFSAGEASTGVIAEYNLRYCRVLTPRSRYVIFADMSNELTTMRHLFFSCLLIGAAALLVFLGISILLARWAVKPVEQAWQQQKSFVADASHELKLPLTVILTHTELLQLPDCTDAERLDFSRNIRTVAHQMQQLVESLLDLARADSGERQTLPALVGLSSLVTRTALPWEAALFEASLTLETRIAPGIQVRGEEAGLGRVLDILLDNARKYASPGTEVLVTLCRTGRKRCLLTVSNAGPPLTKEQLSRLFQRFYRADPARSRSQSYGLGLAIAQSIVQAHKGTIRAESLDGQNRFLVELPCLPGS